MTDLLSRLAALAPADRAAVMARLRPGAASEHAPDRPAAGTPPVTREWSPRGPRPASPAQNRLWLVQQMDPGNPAYNLAAGLRLHGSPVVDVLAATLSEILRRHEVLRTAFPAQDGSPVQVVAPPGPVNLPIVDLRGDDGDRLRRHWLDQGRRPFELDRAPLARFSLVRLGADEWLLTLVVHHLVADGWSFAVFAREFGQIYAAFAAGRPSPLPDPSIQYADVAGWQSDWLDSAAAEAQLSYWTGLLAGDLPVLDLPTDRPRPAQQTFHGRLHRFELEPAVAAALRRQAAHAGQTLHTGLLAVFADLLHRVTGQPDLIIGTPVSGRSRAESADLIGFFVTTLPLRVDLTGGPTHREIARRIHRLAGRAFAHADVPFDRIVQAVRPPRDPSRPALRQVAFAFQTVPAPAGDLQGLSVQALNPAEIDLGVAPLDLSMHMWEEPDGALRGCFGYNTDLFDERTVAAWADQFRALARQASEDPDRPPPSPAEQLRAASNLTETQLLFWFGKKYEPDVRLYFEHVTTVFTIGAAIEREHFGRAFQALIDRSDSLRSVFEETDGVPQRRVRDRVDARVEVVDLGGAADPEAALEQWVADRGRADFDLADRLFDCALLRLGPKKWAWYLNVHHLISDAWSTTLVVRQVSAYYRLAREGRLAEAGPMPAYRDYVEYARELRETARYRRSERYWREKLAETASRLDFYRRESAARTTRTARVSVDLGPERTRRIREFARREGLISPAVVLATALFGYVHRVSGERLLRIGTPLANRPTQFRDTIGLFMNACPMQVEVAGEEDFLGLARQVQLELIQVGRHQEYPVANPAHEPVYDVYFNFQNASFAGFDAPVEVTLIGTDHSHDRLALQVRDFEGTARYVLDFDFNVACFDEAERERSARHYLSLLDAALAEPTQRVSRLPLLTESERHRILGDFNRTDREYPLDVPLHEWVRRQVDRTPDIPAVVFEDHRLTYRELDEAANRLAARLRRCGVQADSVVGVCLERSVHLVVALLGVLKAGGAYLPLEPSYPAERLGFMLADAEAGVLLTTAREADLLPPYEAHTILVDEDAGDGDGDGATAGDVAVQPDDLAYVMYTSGSTGQPKAVMMPHRGVCNRLLWMQERYGLTADDRVLQKTPFSFDVSVWEFFWPLMTGATLVVDVPGGHQDPAHLVETITRERITTVHFVPSMLRVFLQAQGVDGCASLTRVICSGEALPADLPTRFYDRLGAARLHNLYGPTEASIDVTAWECPPDEPEGTPDVPIGRPIANTAIYILDRHRNPTPVGIPGELHIGGVGLARGYLHRPQLTAERFIPDPFGDRPDGRLYRTGDLARFRPDGTIEFLGRLDGQVKLRGFRIELGEIETELLRHPAVAGAAATVRPGPAGEATLVGYVVPEVGAAVPSASELRTFLGVRLPEHMLPTQIQALATLPITPNGKLDRKALPEMVRPSGPAGGYVAPRTPLERTIARRWAEVLGMDRVGVHDGFFELGGHSLLAARLVARLGRDLALDLPLATLFRAPTVAEFAALCADAARRGGVLVPIRSGAGRPLFVLHPAGGDVMVYHHLSTGLESVVGVQSRALGGAAAEHQSLQEMADEYASAIRERQATGPYRLLGWSMGGLLAVSVAKLIEDAGERVELLGLVDSHVPEPGAEPDPLLAPAVALAHAVPDLLNEVHLAELPALREELGALPLAARMRRLTEWARHRGSATEGEPEGLLPRAELAALHERLAIAHEVPVVDASLTVWWAREDLRNRPHATDWRRHTTGGVVERTVAGNHFTMLRPPAVGALADQVRAALAGGR